MRRGVFDCAPLSPPPFSPLSLSPSSSSSFSSAKDHCSIEVFRVQWLLRTAAARSLPSFPTLSLSLSLLSLPLLLRHRSPFSLVCYRAHRDARVTTLHSAAPLPGRGEKRRVGQTVKREQRDVSRCYCFLAAASSMTQSALAAALFPPSSVFTPAALYSASARSLLRLPPAAPPLSLRRSSPQRQQQHPPASSPAPLGLTPSSLAQHANRRRGPGRARPANRRVLHALSHHRQRRRGHGQRQLAALGQQERQEEGHWRSKERARRRRYEGRAGGRGVWWQARKSVPRRCRDGDAAPHARRTGRPCPRRRLHSSQWTRRARPCRTRRSSTTCSGN